MSPDKRNRLNSFEQKTTLALVTEEIRRLGAPSNHQDKLMMDHLMKIEFKLAEAVRETELKRRLSDNPRSTRNAEVN